MTTTSTDYSTTSSNILADYRAKQAEAAAASATTTSSANSAALTSSTGSLTTFLKILTTQLQNQDPTSATDTNQFTQELIQFASAEQQINTNTKLDTITGLLKSSSSVAGTIGYIGKYVAVPSTDKMALQNGTSELSYSLDSAASRVAIAVKDASGKTVATLNGATAAGTNYVSWDGKDSSGKQLDDGTYTFTIGATNSFGATVNVSDTKAIAKVTSVSTNDDGTTNLGLGTGFTVLNSKVETVYDGTALPTATAM